MTDDLRDRLCGIAVQVLGLDGEHELGDASLLELGGSSIKAMIISAHAEERWGLEVSIDVLLEPRPLRVVLAELAGAAPPLAGAA